MRSTIVMISVLIAGCASTPQTPQTVTAKIHKVNAAGLQQEIGTVKAMNEASGLALVINLRDLPPGEHGFHVHENGSCEPKEKDGVMTAALGAGGHYDPHGSGKHEGPAGNGHLGDLPVLKVGLDGTAKAQLLAPRLTVSMVRNRAIVVHAGADNFADAPQPLGGGGARVACGVFR